MRSQIEQVEIKDFKIFFRQFIVKSELIGFFLITPFYATLSFFMIEIPYEKARLFTILCLITVLGVFIYSILSLWYFKKKIKPFYLYIFQNQNYFFSEDEFQEKLKFFYKIPLIKGTDVFFKVIIAFIIFIPSLRIYFDYDINDVVTVALLMFLWGGTWGAFSFFLTDRLILQTINSEEFKNQLKNHTFSTYIPYRYILMAILFFAYLLLTIIFSFVVEITSFYFLKKIHEEDIEKDLSKISFNINKQMDEMYYIMSFLDEKRNHLKREEWTKMINFSLNFNPQLLDYGIYDISKKDFVYTARGLLEEFKDEIEKEKNYSISNVYISKETGEKVIFFIHELNESEKSVLLINFIKWGISVMNFTYSSNDIYLMIDRNNYIILSNHKDYLGKNANEIGDNLTLDKLLSHNSNLYNKFYYNKKILEVQFRKDPKSQFYLCTIYSKESYKKNVFYQVIIASIITLILGLSFTIFITYMIQIKTKALEKISDGLTKIANGDLQKGNYDQSYDEFGIAAKYIVFLEDNFSSILKKTKESIRQTKLISDKFRDLTHSLVERAENEAATTEEISATIEEISGSMDKITDSTSQQNEWVKNLNQLVSDLTQVVKEAQGNIKEILSVVQSSDHLAQTTKNEIDSMSLIMNEIKNISSQISNVVNLVKDIADQINLLSLNASIEAARAGEYGRGFAVVASEISKLAEKTMLSTKDIHSLIKNTTNQIQKSIQISENVKNIFFQVVEELKKISQFSSKISEVVLRQEFVNKGILTQMKSVSDKSGEVYLSILEQKKAIKEITESIFFINQNIIQTSDNAKIIDKEAIEVSHTIQELEDMINKNFKIEN